MEGGVKKGREIVEEVEGGRGIDEVCISEH